MEKILTLEEFYKIKLNYIPDNLKKGLGHFNVFRIDDCLCSKKKPIPYSRKEYFKITLLKGKYKIAYADKTFESDKHMLIFSNPMIPYTWESLEGSQTGFFCIFTEDFFSEYGNLKDYPMFKPGQNNIYSLTDEQAKDIENIYLHMFDEINSEFAYKYDVIRGLSFNLMHYALKIHPAKILKTSTSNAASRITSMFIELLERQFPIETALQQIRLRSPYEFSEQLSVHVNHLNRILKETTGKTTSTLISERIMQEARMLLRHTNWTIAEIGRSLGFEESSHFINFFHKNEQTNPKAYRDHITV